MRERELERGRERERREGDERGMVRNNVLEAKRVWDEWSVD